MWAELFIFVVVLAWAFNELRIVKRDTRRAEEAERAKKNADPDE